MLRSGGSLAARWRNIGPRKAAVTAQFDTPMGSSRNPQMPAFGMPKSRPALIVAVLLAVLSYHPARAQMPSPFGSWQNDSGIVLRDIGGPIVENPNQLGGSLNVDYEF